MPTDASRPVPDRTLLESLPDATVLMDGNGVVLWANPSAERQLGRDLQDWIDRSCLDLIHPCDLEQATIALTSVQGKDVGTPIEVRIRTSAGWKLAEVVGAPVSGTAGHIVITMRDLTERRRWEVAGDETGKLRALLHHAPTLFILVDPDGAVLATSGAITRALGLDQAELEGRPLVDLVVPEERERLRSAVERALRDRSSRTMPERVEVQLRDEGRGRTVPYELSIVDLTDDPTVGGLVVTGHDVSERRAAEEELRDMLSLLHATLDATADGILVVDQTGRITSFNARLLDMWQLPSDSVVAGADHRTLRNVSEQLCDPAQFLRTVAERYEDPETESFDLLDFWDGRVFERYSKPQRVGGEVVGRVWGFHDITRQKQLERELEHQAFHDQLTGLANQALFRDRVDHALARAARDGTGLAVLYLDIDDFKRVNDSLGHRAGDELLVAVTERLRVSVRESDTIARLGGDEFAVLIENLESTSHPTDLATRIIAEFGRALRLGRRELVTSVSIGIAFNEDGLATEQLLRNADLAMYAAKGRGKGRYELYASGMHSDAVARLEIESDLRAARGRGEFWVAYQPIVELTTTRVMGIEALLRWNHPQWGLLGPDTFIGAAEDFGIIGDIGEFVLREACSQLDRWTREGKGAQLSMSVNVSARQLVHGTVIEQVRNALDESGLAPHRLVLELTETAMLQDTAGAKRTLDALKELGVRLALDDFGTGFSSLTHLQQFPIDIIKIDRSFMTTIGQDAALVKAVIRMSQELGLVAIAEGIETAEQLTFLQDAGCELGQGHFFAQPVGATAMDALLDQRFTAPGGGTDRDRCPGPNRDRTERATAQPG